jgi:uncharacterized membrane protein YccC
LALLIYAAWPTWERTQVADALAQMFDAYRIYFRLVSRMCDPDHPAAAELDHARMEWRSDWSNAEASVDRLEGEPRTSPQQLSCLNAILAASHQLIHAFTGLEAGFRRIQENRLPPTFKTFANDIEFTLYFLSSALRNESTKPEHLPVLRDDFNKIVLAGPLPDNQQFLIAETDRIVTSVNTIREQVIRWLQLTAN